MKKVKTKEKFECVDLNVALDKIKKWSSERRLLEVCGFLGFKNGEYKLLLCENISQKPSEYFAINPVDYLNFIEEYNMICVFHSHVKGNEEASQFDVSMSENCCIPFMVYSLNTKKFSIYSPRNNDVDKDLLQNVIDAI